MPVSTIGHKIRSLPVEARAEIQAVLLAADLDVKKAAAHVGVHFQTFYSWMKALKVCGWLKLKKYERRMAIKRGDGRLRNGQKLEPIT